MAAIKGYQHPGSPKGTKRGHYNTGTANSHYTHGRCNTAEYRAYTNAKQRCTNPNNSRYSDWGGRGIRFLFCSFKAFFSN